MAAARPVAPRLFHIYIPAVLGIFVPARRRQSGSTATTPTAPASVTVGIYARLVQQALNVLDVRDGFAKDDGFRVGGQRLGKSVPQGLETSVYRPKISSDLFHAPWDRHPCGD